jgi:MORN repeat variant
MSSTPTKIAILLASVLAALIVYLGFIGTVVVGGTVSSGTLPNSQHAPLTNPGTSRNDARSSPAGATPSSQLPSSRAGFLNSEAERNLTRRESEGVHLVVAGEPCVVRWDGDVRRILYEKGGVCAETTFRGGEMHGADKAWHPNGQLWSRGEWRDNKREGLWEYFTETGVLSQRGEHLDGKMSGEWVTYHDDGTVASIGSYIGQVRVGEWLFFDSSGSVYTNQSGWYEDGSRVSDY